MCTKFVHVVHIPIVRVYNYKLYLVIKYTFYVSTFSLRICRHIKCLRRFRHIKCLRRRRRRHIKCLHRRYFIQIIALQLIVIAYVEKLAYGVGVNHACLRLPTLAYVNGIATVEPTLAYACLRLPIFAVYLHLILNLT